LTARIELVPTLEHCIETTARQAFTRNKDEYIQRGVADKELEERIDLLRTFLDTMDFGKLRRESEPHLLEGKSIKFLLYWEDGKPKYEMRVED
jgi:hypothetical protein